MQCARTRQGTPPVCSPFLASPPTTRVRHTQGDPVIAAAVDIQSIHFEWKKGHEVLRIARFEIGAGERVFLRGPSGSGKSTLLSLISGVAGPASSGRIDVLGEDIGRLSSARRDALRADRMGVIFQMFNLVPYLSVLENVVLPLRFSTERRRRVLQSGGSMQTEAARLLAQLGLDGANLAGRKPNELSVGQQQRVAAARAMIGGPDLVLADEPTSALDSETRGAFVELLLQECSVNNASLLFVSHDTSLSPLFDRTVNLLEINQAGQERETA